VGERFDVVVVGGGAAGLSGAVALARSRRTVLVVDAGQPRNAPATGVHNFLRREGACPADVFAAGRAEVAMYGGRIKPGRVTAVRRLDGPSDDPETRFALLLDDGGEVWARRLLVATGAVDELPPVPGVAERWGRDVLHCPYCHGWEARDRAIGILGTGPLVVHSALLWRQLSDDVVLFHHTAPALSEEQIDQLAARDIRVVAGEVATLEIVADRLAGVRLRSGKCIPREVVVVASRIVAQSGWLANLGLETVDLDMGGQVIATRVEAGAAGATAVPGVWVAGNVTDPMAQVVSAASDGLRAGAAINADLAVEDAALAVAGHAHGRPRS
jgi:thioredoxin reductase